MNAIATTLCTFIKSSIGRKMIVGLTGLMLVLFLAGHLAGNLTFFFGPEAINAYAAKLHSMPPALLWSIRLGLLAVAGLHIILTLKLNSENLTARKQYEVKAHAKSTASSRYMIGTGVIILGFIVIHLLQFTIRQGGFFNINYAALAPGQAQGAMLDGKEVYNVFGMIVQGFSVWWVSLIYIIAMLCVCSHLQHGVQSIFQTCGLATRKTLPLITFVSRAYAWIITLGFISLPVAVLVFGYGKCCG